MCFFVVFFCQTSKEREDVTFLSKDLSVKPVDKTFLMLPDGAFFKKKNILVFHVGHKNCIRKFTTLQKIRFSNVQITKSLWFWVQPHIISHVY